SLLQHRKNAPLSWTEFALSGVLGTTVYALCIAGLCVFADRQSGKKGGPIPEVPSANLDH
ncbi:MAG TPA: hypothetical protein VHU84_06780, partial [Lacipirellulaceae bacterium]|nr:hypothetical protein [Lacipirellulaceae bacterium]